MKRATPVLIFCSTLLFACSDSSDTASTSNSRQNNSGVTGNSSTQVSPHTAPNKNAVAISRDAQTALFNLYGGRKWSDKALAEYFDGQTTGYITPVFAKPFKSQGKDKLLVLGLISNEEEAVATCHACSALVGGAIFTKQNDVWAAESQKKIIGWGGPFGSLGDADVVQIGKDRFGVTIRLSDMHQGYEDAWIKILVPIDGLLVDALNIGFSEKPSPGACEKPMDQQSLNVEFVHTDDSDYFPVIVRIKYNDGDCDHIARHDETKRLRFSNGKYIPDESVAR